MKKKKANKKKQQNTKSEIIRVAGKLKEVVTVLDGKGNVLHKMIQPLMVEFYPRDVIQIIVGATILAIPVVLTEETWALGETLPWLNVFIILAMSLVFVSLFVYFNYYRRKFKSHVFDFCKRVIVTYVLSFAVVAALLSLIQMAPWQTNMALAMKRIIIVTLPATMSAAIVDVIK